MQILGLSLVASISITMIIAINGLQASRLLEELNMWFGYDLLRILMEPSRIRFRKHRVCVILVSIGMDSINSDFRTILRSRKLVY